MEARLVPKSVEIFLESQNINLVRKIGDGTYGKVYLATRKNSTNDEDILFACKIIDTKNISQEYVLKFLPRELNIILKLKHSSIINLKKIFHNDDKFFFLMRYAEMGDLLQYIQKIGPLKEIQAQIWSRQIALGLKYMHNIDVAHRDLKCENILITSHFNVKLSDFGFVRYCVDKHKRPILSDTFCGSIMYAAPEIILGKPYEPKKVDIWSMGVITFIMLNDAFPFNEIHPKKLYFRQINNQWDFKNHIICKLSISCILAVQNLLEPVDFKRIDIDTVLRLNWMTSK